MRLLSQALSWDRCFELRRAPLSSPALWCNRHFLFSKGSSLDSISRTRYRKLLHALRISFIRYRRLQAHKDTEHQFVSETCFPLPHRSVYAILGTLLPSLIATTCEAAEAGVAYNPDTGAETLKTVAGAAYILVVIVYFLRLFRRRAENATKVSLTSSSESTEAVDEGLEDDEEELSDDEAASEASRDGDITPLQCFVGFVQAGTISYLLYLLSTRVDGYFAKQDLPTQYTAHNVAVLIQTVVRGLMYLVTFIFAANATGLALLGIQVAIDPESVRDDGLQRRRQEERLPSVKATDDIFAIRRAFQEAEQMGKRSVQKTPNDGDSKERGDA